MGLKMHVNFRKQNGAALLIMMLVLILTASTFMIARFDNRSIEIERDKKTAAALAEAKQALIAYSQNEFFKKPCSAGKKCARPGDLPCPALDNSGKSEPSCGDEEGSSGQDKRLGLFPWKTLGVGDLRDGYGERLWYAVSNNYKNNTKKIPLNIDTLGTISLRDASGKIIYDGSKSNGLAALLISAGPPIKSQKREMVTQLDVNNYLDTFSIESNAGFIDGTNNGFIKGPIFDLEDRVIVNDKFLEIKTADINTAIIKVILLEAKNELLNYYCGYEKFNHLTLKCLDINVGNKRFPMPAAELDSECHVERIYDGKCLENSNVNFGIFAANPSQGWGSVSILDGYVDGNWFQQNNWRKIIRYYISNSCSTNYENCKFNYSIQERKISIQ